MQGSYGPFRPNIEVEVPFWLGIAFYKRKSCRIKPPAWLATDYLQGELLAHLTCPLQHQPWRASDKGGALRGNASWQTALSA